MPSLTSNQAFIVTEHRKKTTMYPVDEKQYASIDSALSAIEEPRKNISKAAWNKIRLAEIK